MEASSVEERAGRPGPPRRCRGRRRELLVFVPALFLLLAVGTSPHEPGAYGGTPGDTPVALGSVVNGVAGDPGIGPGAPGPETAAPDAPSDTPPGTGRAVFRSAVVVLGVIIAVAVIFVRLRRLRGRL